MDQKLKDAARLVKSGRYAEALCTYHLPSLQQRAECDIEILHNRGYAAMRL